MKPIAATIFLTTAQGAAPSVHAATKELTQLNEVECEHFGPYRTYEGWELFIDAWQPSFLTKVTKSKVSKRIKEEESKGRNQLAGSFTSVPSCSPFPIPFATHHDPFSFSDFSCHSRSSYWC